jgi:hypothetical protein
MALVYLTPVFAACGVGLHAHLAWPSEYDDNLMFTKKGEAYEKNLLFHFSLPITEQQKLSLRRSSFLEARALNLSSKLFFCPPLRNTAAISQQTFIKEKKLN